MSKAVPPAFWFAELRANSRAPDFHLKMEFRVTGDDVRCRSLGFPWNSFRFLKEDAGRSLYVCADDFDDYVAHKRRHFSTLIMISLSETSLEIDRYGGGHELSDYGEEEMELIQSLIEQPSIELLEWTVFSSGDGAKGDLAKEGRGKASFLNYLEQISVFDS